MIEEQMWFYDKIIKYRKKDSSLDIYQKNTTSLSGVTVLSSFSWKCEDFLAQIQKGS